MPGGASLHRALRAGLAPLLCCAVAACVTAPSGPAAHDPTHHAAYPEATPYDADANAMAAVDAALDRAAQNGRRVLLVMGANWCHDSRALAGWLEQPRLADLLARHYETVFVDIGVPQTGDGRNLDIARRFGLDTLPGTPNLLVLTSHAELLNADTATTWRNAASRNEDAIFEELARLAVRAVPGQEPPPS